MGRKRTAAFIGVALTGAAGATGWAVVDGRASSARQPVVTSVATSTAPVVRADVADRRQVTGTLGYAGTHDVIATGGGTLTRLPAVGGVVDRGDPAYEVDGLSVVLFYGKRAPWREFRLGMTAGPDIRQLEDNLRALGYGTGMTVDKRFSSATYWAVRAWQHDENLPVTGTIPLGQIVFASSAVRIGAHNLKVGSRVQPGTSIARGTGRDQAVTVQLPPAQLPRVRRGDQAMVTLPDGATRDGRVTAIGAVAAASGGSEDGGPNGSSGNPGGEEGPTAPVTIKVSGPIRGFLDQAEVQVAITQDVRRNVLAVPLTALRGLPGGRYEVVVVDGTTRRRVPVETGLFDETAGLAEVSGPGLSEGQKVEVPRDGA